MKRIWLLALIICITASLAFAQVRFSIQNGINGFSDLSTDVIVLSDSGYFTVTQSVDFFNVDTLGFAITSILIIKTNEQGNTIWKKIYRKKNFNIRFNTYAKTPNGFLMVGSITDLVAYENEQKGGYFGIWKLDELGDTLSTNYYDVFSGNDYSTQLIPTLDSGYMVVGQSCNQIQTGANCDFIMLKLDSNGNVQWHKTHSNTITSFETGYGIIQMPNEDFYLVGNTQINGLMKTFVVKTDKFGKLLWKKKIDNYPRENINSILFNNESNELFLVGSYSTQSNGTGNSRGLVYCMDTSGKVNWKKSIGGPQNCGVFSATIRNNKLYLGGYFEKNNINEGWLYSLSLNGDSLFQRMFFVHITQNIYSIKNAIDGFIMAGYCYNPNDSIANQDAWLLKVDTFGCLTPGCQLVGINNIPFSREEIKIYPNPAKHKIKFEHSAKIISYRIADYTGKLLLEGAYNSINIDVSALPAGAYIVQVMLEDGSQAFAQLVVE